MDGRGLTTPVHAPSAQYVYSPDASLMASPSKKTGYTIPILVLLLVLSPASLFLPAPAPLPPPLRLRAAAASYSRHPSSFPAADGGEAALAAGS
jgi:hypothetical protein